MILHAALNIGFVYMNNCLFISNCRLWLNLSSTASRSIDSLFYTGNTLSFSLTSTLFLLVFFSAAHKIQTWTVAMTTVECLAIQKKRSVIVERIATATDLTWFSGKLRENEFIDARRASSVTSMQGVSPADKVSQLLDAVEAKIKLSDPHRVFNQFVAIIESNPCLKDVSQILDKTRQEIRDHATSYAPPENDNREDSIGEDGINDPAASLPSRRDSSATWSTIPVQPAHVDSFEMENGDPAQLPTCHSKNLVYSPPIVPEKNESAAKLECADGEGHAIRIATGMSVPHYENGTMQSSIMVHGSPIEQTPTPQSDSSAEDRFRPEIEQKDQQIAALNAEIDRLNTIISTLEQQKDRINADLREIKSSCESTLKKKEDELRECKDKLSLKEQENYRMREELRKAFQKAELEEKERITQYEELTDQKLKGREELYQLQCEKHQLESVHNDKIHELELRLRDKDVALEKSKREVAEKESQVRILQAQESDRKAQESDRKVETLTKRNAELERRLSEQDVKVAPYPPKCVYFRKH